ncbi:MAG: hypothetical protein JHC61_12450 [Burkholderiaceae bacterium]|nr:hypothetical protein [Burkholderiaceae bacterium]
MRLDKHSYSRIFVIVLIVALAFYSSVATAVPLPISKYVGQWNFTIERSIRHPYAALDHYNAELTEHGSGPEYTVEISRHHVIPQATLRGFFRALIQNDHMHLLSSYFESLASNMMWYLIDNGAGCDVERWSEAGSMANAISTRVARPERLAPTPPPAYHALQQMMFWMPANLFYGPTRRADDPEWRFEYAAGNIVMPSQYDMLRETYSLMEDYINVPLVSTLSDINEYLTVLAGITQITALASAAWILLPDKVTYSINPHYVAGTLAGLSRSQTAMSSNHTTCKGYAPIPRAAFIVPLLLND